MGMLKAFLGFGVNGGHIAVVTGYALQFEKIQEQLRRLQLADPHRGWKQINLLTANTVQAEEYEIVILSLVKTKGKRGYLGEKKWANLVCTRHREAMYFIGNWDFWTSKNASGNTWLDKILYRIRDSFGRKSLTGGRPEFVVHGQPASSVTGRALPPTSPKTTVSAPGPSIAMSLAAVPAAVPVPVPAPAPAPAPVSPPVSPPVAASLRARARTLTLPPSSSKPTRQDVDVRVVELKEKIAVAKSDNADARTTLLEERERKMREHEEVMRRMMREHEEMMRRKAEEFTAAMKKLKDEGRSSDGALEDDLRRLQG
ncbi:MAG: hypothetical protein ALECFALPRED_007445 [Alectoria fallacina]|uniref:DNA2/NAM7 helicase-like C-terminal domain-containing protein n=1 Tax=Alectoria fallacina TaxID=1903189 RepID=A0A8H3GAI3_9LECA|nr:MAG: hypothetical protein ALECFALPRED_007445 [Alectoria fallacina]